MERWFTSDPHYGHGRVIGYCGRPFSSSWEMNETLIENHNSVVRPNDEVYLCGDISFMGTGKTIEVLKRLNGKLHIIRGNHDKVMDKEEVQYYIEWIKDRHMLSVPDKTANRGAQLIVLDHYSGRVWNKRHWGAWQLYGHSHGSLPEDPDSLSFDVGVDAIAKRYAKDGILDPKDYRPICYDEVKLIMEAKTNLAVDHHV